MLGRLLNRIFPGPPPNGPSSVPVFSQPDPTPVSRPKERGWLAPYIPLIEPPPLTARDVEIQKLTSALEAVARRGYTRLYAAAPVPAPGPEADQAKLREHALRDVQDRVKMFCLGEVQNQRPKLALEYRKAFDVFNALWKMMQGVDPKDLGRGRSMKK